MKTLHTNIRPLNAKELKTLSKIRSRGEKELSQAFAWAQPLFAIVLCALSLYLATWTRYDLVTFFLGLFAIFCLAFAVIRPYEYYKDRRKANSLMNRVAAGLQSGVVEVAAVTAKQVALAKAADNEDDLYIIEMDKGNILYMWDTFDNLKKNFPCLQFEIYSDDFASLIGRQISPLSEKIKPIALDPKAIRDYFKKAGAPGHLAVEKKSFGKLMERVGSSK